ncbi:MAG: putative multidrug resistance protein SugE [Pseudomonadota bacterium]|jgi:quaternary ammonium compound-resistance protein SugE
MSAGQAWALLFVAGLLEIAWALALKASDGFSRWLPSLVVVVGALASFWLLALAMRVLPAGTAYAVWTGIGAVGTAILGILWLGEPAGALRVACILLIVAGVIGLKFVGA